MAYHQHKQMQGESAAISGYANAALAQPKNDISEVAIDAFANLATATATDANRGSVTTLTDTNSRLAKQLEESAQALNEIRALLKKKHNYRATRK
jgi:hypothetical protein